MGCDGGCEKEATDDTDISGSLGNLIEIVMEGKGMLNPIGYDKKPLDSTEVPKTIKRGLETDKKAHLDFQDVSHFFPEQESH